MRRLTVALWVLALTPALAFAQNAERRRDQYYLFVAPVGNNFTFGSTTGTLHFGGGWIGGAVILGKTGIGMSVRGEQFWLDKTRAAQLRPRARPRYTLTPSIVLRDGRPFMAIGTPGGDNQDQTILQAFHNIVEFWPDWYPNLHESFEWPRVQTLHFYGSFWPHTPGFNKLNLESPIPDAVLKDLESRGHDVTKIKAFSIASCATAVLIDPANGNRIAGAEPRRDCYAMAY